ncbi:hypothetical protein B4U80_08537 [Leptotrombidium deliense]|uniref:Uncharacterized protein n=1 Tax=Leptotrombidium deliense TaxID=299467 RepID=A0A443Q8D1_9ACAR|nr:hypothetical protein B4U80_08537 [Leptotrombidium deliense]
MVKYLFVNNVEQKEWACKYYTIHTLYRWRWQYAPNSPRDILERDIWTLNTTFGNMARSRTSEVGFLF